METQGGVSVGAFPGETIVVSGKPGDVITITVLDPPTVEKQGWEAVFSPETPYDDVGKALKRITRQDSPDFIPLALAIMRDEDLDKGSLRGNAWSCKQAIDSVCPDELEWLVGVGFGRSFVGDAIVLEVLNKPGSFSAGVATRLANALRSLVSSSPWRPDQTRFVLSRLRKLLSHSEDFTIPLDLAEELLYDRQQGLIGPILAVETLARIDLHLNDNAWEEARQNFLHDRKALLDELFSLAGELPARALTSFAKAIWVLEIENPGRITPHFIRVLREKPETSGDLWFAWSSTWMVGNRIRARVFDGSVFKQELFLDGEHDYSTEFAAAIAELLTSPSYLQSIREEESSKTPYIFSMPFEALMNIRGSEEFVDRVIATICADDDLLYKHAVSGFIRKSLSQGFLLVELSGLRSKQRAALKQVEADSTK